MKSRKNLILLGAATLGILSAISLWLSSEPRQPITTGTVSAVAKTPVAPAGEPLSVPDATPEPVEPSADVQEQVVAAPEETPREPDLSKLTAFDNWVAGWKSAAPEERRAMIAEGSRLAGERRPEFKALISHDPRLAVERAVKRVTRQDLPAEIVAQLEKPVSAVGELNVYQGLPAPGLPRPADGMVLRYFEAEGVSYKAYVPDALKSVQSRKRVPLQGYADGRDLAVAENSVRPLDVGEQIPAGTVVQANCPVSGKTTESISPGTAVTAVTSVVEIGESIITLCDSSHVQVLEGGFRTYIQASGSGGSGFFADNFPGTSSRAIGNFKCLYLRVTYPDQMTFPNTEATAYSDMANNARFYRESSYGKMVQTTTFAPLIVLPHTVRWYYDVNGTVDSLGLIHTDARAAAKAMGYDDSQFDCVIVRVNGGPKLDGASWGGGNSVWVSWDGMDVLNHECGHSLGLNHANAWVSDDGTPYGLGHNGEYGNPYDVMGGAYGMSGHYTTVGKRTLGWLPANTWHSATTSGTYRIYAYDQPQIEEGKRYALVAPKDSSRSYNLEYHPARGGQLASSALVLYSGTGSNDGHLLDVSPVSGEGGIPVGRTFSDFEADMHFTVLSVNGTTPPSLDIAYNRGPFPGNVAPTATLAASATTINVGQSVTFTATASDANGDPLAYQWQFDDGVYGSNTPVFTRTFVAAAQVTAMLTVSDMKGGSVRRSVVINVGAHGKQTITGTVTAGGSPLQDVYISDGSKFCYTSADGTYSLSGLATGSHTLTARLAGYTFTPTTANPYTVVAGTNTVNWTGTAPTFVTLRSTADATEGGANGNFRLTRTGDTSADLVVSVSPVSGTATKLTDYAFTPDGAYKSFTIPAGSATLDIAVAAVDDTLAEGPETINLQLTSAAGYYSGSGNAAVMTVIDNDTTLPQVAVRVPDPYATEGPGSTDGGTFTFTRTGSTSAALDIAVAWSGTATNGDDFTTLPATVTIPAGQSQVNVPVSPVDDSLIEIPETVIATINTNAAYVRDPGGTTGTVTITDDDTPHVTVTALDPDASEEGQNNGLFLVTRTGSTAAPLTVYYGVVGSAPYASASYGTDYEALPGQVTIPAGASSAPVVVTPYDDDFAEPTESVTIGLTTFNDTYSVGSPYLATVTITDSTDVPLISVRNGTVGTEGGSNSSVVFYSTGISTGGTGTVAVHYTVSGTATAGSDYTALSGTVNVPASGYTGITVTIPILNDLLVEPTETVVVTIVPDAGYRTYNDSSATAYIRDNDSGSERVIVSTYNQSPAEAASKVGTFYVSRTGTTGDLTANYVLSGTATNGTDYAALSGTCLIPDGKRGVDLVITPIDDTIQEGTETVVLTVSPGTGYSPDFPASASFEIADNETMPITVGFQQATLATTEQPGPLGEYRDLPVILSAPSANTVSVRCISGGGKAMGDDVDWAFVDAANGNAVVPSATVTFPPGATLRNLRIRIKNDGYSETSETAVLKLLSPVNASLTSGYSQQTVTITDGTMPRTVRLLTSATSRSELDGSEPMLVAVLDRPATTAITVDYDISGTATNGSDYTVAPGPLTFVAGEQFKPIPLVILNDAIAEAPESIIVSLSNPSGAEIVSPSVHTITLADSMMPVVADQFVTASSSQSVGTLIATASATPAAGRTITGWTLRGGNAANAFAVSSGGQVTLVHPDQLPNPGGVQLIVRATDSAGATGDGAVNIICNPGVQPVSEQRWSSTPAYNYDDWTGATIYTGTLPNLTPPQNVADNFSRRLLTYLKPQVSGDYTFWIAADATARLYLGTGGYESGKVQIASTLVASPFQFWDSIATQKSLSIPLVAGQCYWLEVQHYESTGAEHVSVAWAGPGIPRAEIPSNVLFPSVPGIGFVPPAPVVGEVPTLAITSPSSGDVFASGNVVTVSADVVPNGQTISAVEFYRDGTRIGSDTDAPYSVSYTAVQGLQTLTARVRYSGTFASSDGVDIEVLDSSLAIDADGDGFLNGLEITLGTDPYDAASKPDPIYSGLRAWWKFDESSGTVADDATGRPQDGTLLNGPTWGSSLMGNALTFNGTNQSVEVQPLNLNSNTVTISTWVKRNGDQPDYTGIVFTRENAASGLTFGENNELRYRWNNLVSSYSFNSNLTVPDNTWTFCAVVVEPTKATFYMRPVGGAMQSAVYTAAQSPAPFNSKLYLGQDTYGGRFVKGTLEDVRIYSRSLSGTEIATLFNTYPTYTAPTFTADPITGAPWGADGVYAATLAGSAIDPDASTTLTYSKVSGPAWLNVAADGTLDGAPLASNVGVNVFTVKVTDNTGQTDTATLNITITGNSAPYFTANPVIAGAATEDSAYTGSIAGYGADANPGSTLTYEKLSGPAWLDVAANGALSGTPVNDDNGVNSFVVKVTDQWGTSGTGTLNVTVVNTNDAPVFTSNPIIRGGAVTYVAHSGSIAGDAVDVDPGDSLTFTKLGGPSWLSIASNGSLSGTPAESDAGINSFDVRVADVAGASTTATLQITVTGIAWANPAGGSWTTTGNWNGNVIANGVNSVGNFAMLDLSSDASVTLDGARTIGHLTFGDTVGSHGWFLYTGSAGPLTLDVTTGSPVITVDNQTATIGAVLAGNDGLTKAGPGTLVLSAANTFSGSTIINDGILALGNVSALGSGGVTISDGATLRANYISASPTITNAVTVAAGDSAVLDLIGSGSANNTLTLGTGAPTIQGTLRVTRSGGGTGTTNFSRALTGTGTLEIGNTQAGVVPTAVSGSQGRCVFTSTTAYSGFTGDVHVLNGGNLCFFNGTLNGQDLTVDGGGYVTLLGGATTVVGALDGTGSFAKNTSTNTATLSVASGNFGGVISQSLMLATGTTALTKTSAGTLTLGGINTYTGATTISGGTLSVTGSLANTATTVQSGATLGGTGTLGGAVTVQSGGTLSPGTGGTGTLTINNTVALSGTTAMQVGRTGAALSSDKVVGITTVTYGGTLNVTNTGANALQAGDSFQLFSATTRSGSFGTIVLPTLASGLLWDTTRLAVDGSIQVKQDAAIVQNSYQAWASAQGVNNPGDDSDKDGIANLLEFFLNGNPQAADGSIVPVATLNATQVVLTFKRRDDAEGYVGTEAVQWGSALGNWTDVVLGASSSGPDANGVTVQVIENGAEPDEITVSIPRALAVGGKLFTRLKVAE